MPVWCQKCGAMLPEGLESCPRCGMKINSPATGDEDLNRQEISSLTMDVLRILLIPVLAALVLAFLCYFLFLR